MSHLLRNILIAFPLGVCSTLFAAGESAEIANAIAKIAKVSNGASIEAVTKQTNHIKSKFQAASALPKGAIPIAINSMITTSVETVDTGWSIIKIESAVAGEDKPYQYEPIDNETLVTESEMAVRESNSAVPKYSIGKVEKLSRRLVAKDLPGSKLAALWSPNSDYVKILTQDSAKWSVVDKDGTKTFSIMGSCASCPDQTPVPILSFSLDPKGNLTRIVRRDILHGDLLSELVLEYDNEVLHKLIDRTYRKMAADAEGTSLDKEKETVFISIKPASPKISPLDFLAQRGAAEVLNVDTGETIKFENLKK